MLTLISGNPPTLCKPEDIRSEYATSTAAVARWIFLLAKWRSDKKIRFPHQRHEDETEGERMTVRKEKVWEKGQYEKR